MASKAPAWFDANVYMANKLTQVKHDDPKGEWTDASLAAAFVASGFNGPDAAYDHFMQHGMNEDVAPNTLFNANEYYAAKAAQTYYKGDVKLVTALDVAKIELAIRDAGMNAWSHYETYGSSEGVNPSNAFDGDAYIAAKAAAMGVKPEVVAKAFSDAHLSALDHFLEYAGKGGEGEITKALADTGFTVPLDEQVKPDAGTGQTFTLTTGKDSFPGTALDDMFTAENAGVGGQTHTLTAGDTLDGGAGNDTLLLNDQGAVHAGLQTVKNIENLKVYQSNGWNGDVSEFAGLQNVEVTTTGTVTLTAGASVTDVAVNNATTLVDLTGNGIANVSAQNMKGDVALTVNNTTADHTLNVALNKVGTVDTDGTAKTVLTIADAAAETIALTSNGLLNVAKISTDAANTVLKTVNIAGKGDLVLNLDATNNTAVTTINGEKAEGNLTLTNLAAATATITTGAGDDSFTTGAITGKATINTGAGDDKVTLATGAVLTAGSTITLGDGDDTLTMNFADLTKDLKIDAGTHTADGGDALIFNAATGGAAATFTKDQYALVKDSGFEVFGATTGGNLTADASQLGVKDFYVENTGALHLDHMVDGSNVMLSAGGMTGASGEIGASVLNMAKTGDTLNLVLEKIGTLGANTKAGVATDAHTVNVLSDADSAASGADVNELKLTTGANAKVVLTGSQELTYTNGANVAQTIKAEGFEGKLTVTGATGVDTIYAGAGGSTIDGKADDDVITLGTGVDTVVFSAATNGNDTITGFHAGSGGDVLNVLGLGTIGSETLIDTAAAKVSRTAISAKAYLVITDGKAADITTGGTETIADFENTTQVAAYLDEGFTVASGDKNVFAIEDSANHKVYVYAFENDTATGATAIANTELTLVGVATADGTLTLDNIDYASI